jgi:hypothetical protein
MSALDNKGQAMGQLEWPAGVDRTEGEVIAFLQNPENGHIVAATRKAID